MPSLWTLVVGCLGLVSCVSGQNCAGNFFGPAAIDRAKKKADKKEEIQFLQLTRDPITCYGEITRWEFFYDNDPGKCHDMKLQVWRPAPGTSQFTLVGESFVNINTWLPTCNGPIAVMVYFPIGQRIPIQPGDVFGWQDMVPGNDDKRNIVYDKAPDSSSTYGQMLIRNKDDLCTTVGDVCDWLDDRYTTGKGKGKAKTKTKVKYRIRDYSSRIYTDVVLDPIVTNLPTTTRIWENEPAGLMVYQVDLFNRFTSTILVPQVVTWTLSGILPLVQSCNAADYQIDGTGLITTTRPLGAGGPCTLEVICTQGATEIKKNIDITVDGIVDPVTITNLPATVVRDSAVTGNGVTIFTVTGAGTRKIKYTDPYGAPVTITAGGAIRTNQDLANWQSPLYYDIYVTTGDTYYDDGPELFTLVINNIRVPPVIDNLEAVITIPENIASGTDIFTVLATVEARGTAPRFTRPFIYPQDVSGAPAYVFNININSGVVQTAGTYDYFITNRYYVEIVADDTDLFMQSNPKNLTVDITWVNQAPAFASAGFTATVDELEPIGAVIPGLTLDATDRDVPTFDWFDYIINDNPGPGSYLFTADNMTHKVQMAGVVALAPGVASQTYNLEVVAIDSFGLLNPARPVTLAITVVDINDHAPVFSPASYAGTIPGLSPPGTPLGISVTATDDDAGSNAAITYSLLPDAASAYFQINAVTGAISTRQPIDYLNYPSITVTVVATDGGVPPLSSVALVTIDTVELNRHRPEFDPPRFYNIEIRADTPVGDTVLTVQAKDRDTSAVNRLSYYYLTIQYDYGIRRNEGNITVAKNLEAYKKYLLFTNARDNGNPEFESMYPCTVRIDTYDAGSTLVDISLFMTLDDFMASEDRYMQELNTLLDPWVVKLESAHLWEDKTVLTIYALESDSGLGTNLEEPKYFVHRNQILEKLRTNLYGTPKQSLRTSQFDDWQPYQVHPTYPNWLVETPGGIAVLTLLCLLGAAAIIVPIVFLIRKKGLAEWCKKRPRTPRRPLVGPSDDDQFRLSYETQPDEPVQALKYTASPYTAPLVVGTLPPLQTAPPVRKPGTLPPVLQPDRPPPKPRGGTAA